MDGVPALCPQCGDLFLAERIFGGPGKSVLVLEGNSTNCHCGGTAQLLDGKYQYNNGVLSLLAGSKFTRAQVAKLEALSAQIRRGGEVTEDILAAADAVAPELGRVLRLAKQNKWRSLAIAGLIGLALKTCGGSGGSVTINIGPQTTIEQTVVSGQFALGDPYDAQKQEGARDPKAASKSAG